MFVLINSIFQKGRMCDWNIFDFLVIFVVRAATWSHVKNKTTKTPPKIKSTYLLLFQKSLIDFISSMRYRK